MRGHNIVRVAYITLVVKGQSGVRWTAALPTKPRPPNPWVWPNHHTPTPADKYVEVCVDVGSNSTANYVTGAALRGRAFL